MEESVLELGSGCESQQYDGEPVEATIRPEGGITREVAREGTLEWS